MLTIDLLFNEEVHQKGELAQESVLTILTNAVIRKPE